MTDKPKTQIDKFKEAARELGCDDDETHFKSKLAQLAKRTPATKPTRGR